MATLSLTLRLPRTFLLSSAPFGKSSSTFTHMLGEQPPSWNVGGWWRGTRYLLWGKQCHLYHPWLGMVNISPIYLWWNWACDIVFPTSENYTDMPSGNLNLTMEIIRIIRALMCDFAIKPVISHVGLGVPCHIDPWKLWLWRWAAELKHRVST